MSCCISPGESPKIHRREVELEECPITTTEDVSEDTGTYLQHISDRELPDGGPASCIFPLTASPQMQKSCFVLKSNVC